MYRFLRLSPKLELNKVHSRNVSTIRYSKEHEYVRKYNNNYVIGITKYASENVGDLVYIDISVDENAIVESGEIYGLIESVKSSSDLVMPLQCKIVKINEEILEEFEKITEDPISNWLCEIELENEDDFVSLMNEKEYNKFIMDL